MKRTKSSLVRRMLLQIHDLNFSDVVHNTGKDIFFKTRLQYTNLLADLRLEDAVDSHIKMKKP